jgi:hypothetical protein
MSRPAADRLRSVNQCQHCRHDGNATLRKIAQIVAIGAVGSEIARCRALCYLIPLSGRGGAQKKAGRARQPRALAGSVFVAPRIAVRRTDKYRWVRFRYGHARSRALHYPAILNEGSAPQEPKPRDFVALEVTPEVRGVRDGQACHSLPVHRALRFHWNPDAAQHGDRGRTHFLPLLRYRSCLELRRGSLRGAQTAGTARELESAESDSSARATPLRAGFARVSAGNPAPIFRRSGLRRWRPFPE